MAAPVALFLKENLKDWLRARGFWIILAAALIPPALTGAWVATHQADVAATGIAWDPQGPSQGDTLNLTATIVNLDDSSTDAFNVSIRVGFFEERFDGSTVFRDRANETFRVESLGARATREFTMDWTAEPGTWLIEAIADIDNELAEIEELNNLWRSQVQVAFPSQSVDFDPLAQSDVNNTSLPPTDAGVESVTWQPPEIFQNDQVNVTVTVFNRGPTAIDNATVRLQVHRATAVGFSPFPSPDLSESVSLGPDESTEVQFTWSPTQVGRYAVVAVMDTGGAARDTDTSNNALVQQTFIDRELIFEPPVERATAKNFYRGVLELLHLKLLIPLIALFYAAGVLEDEKEKGNLPYLLTRPVPRWWIPVTRFAVSFAVAGIALLAGVIATYYLLLGLPQEAPGFFYWPLLFALLALFVYGALFTLLGVTVERPYLLGLLYVLGWEALVLLGRNVLVNGRPLLQDWVLYLSLNHWVTEAFSGWNTESGFQWLPEGSAAVRAFLVVIGLAVVSLAGAAWWMRRREFHV